MRFSRSAWPVTPNRSSSFRDREPIRKWTWASLKAGMIVPPRASMTRASLLMCARISASEPIAAMRSSEQATAVAGFSPGRQTTPLTNARSMRDRIVPMKIDEEVARAYTLPASMYLDPAVLAQEDERIFARTWQLVAHVSELARPGDFKPTTIIDEPILLTRAQDGNLHGFYNVCRHR